MFSPQQDLSITLPPLKVWGTSWKIGQKDCQRQSSGPQGNSLLDTTGKLHICVDELLNGLSK